MKYFKEGIWVDLGRLKENLKYCDLNKKIVYEG